VPKEVEEWRERKLIVPTELFHFAGRILGTIRRFMNVVQCERKFRDKNQ
jgi:hypothetical protein